MKVTDNSSLTLTFPPDKGSAFAKYLTSSQTIAFELKQKQPDDGLLSKFVPTGLSFTTPIKLGTTSDQLTLKAALQTSVTMKTGSLFDPKKDDFGDSVTIPAGQVYLSLSFNATVDAGISEKTGDLKFGVNAGAGMVLTNYRLFSSTDKIAPALQTVFQGFVIPADLEDIENMAPDAVATIEGTGTLKFSATASYPVYSNPLATMASGPLKGYSAKVGGSLSFALSASLIGGYQVRVRRLDAKRFELGYEKKRGTTLSVTAKAQFGVSAGTGDYDVIAQFLRSADQDFVLDKDSFSEQTGLTEEQISTMATAIKAAIDRKLEASISEQLELSEGKAAAFSYEVDLQKIQNDDKARKAVHDALDGDLRGLESSNFDGVKRLRSVFTSMHESKLTFRLNLLGIFNHGSVTDLLKNGMLIVDRETGMLTIADKATASRVGFTIDNLASRVGFTSDPPKAGAKNGAKLRALVASSVTMTAAYSVGGAIPQAASFSCGCWSFESHHKTNRKNIDHYLHELVGLKLMSPDEARSRQQSVASVADDFGPSTFLVNSNYDNSVFRSMFLSKDKNGKEQLECPAILVPVEMRQTGMRGAWHGTRKETYGGTDCKFAAAD